MRSLSLLYQPRKNPPTAPPLFICLIYQPRPKMQTTIHSTRSCKAFGSSSRARNVPRARSVAAQAGVNVEQLRGAKAFLEELNIKSNSQPIMVRLGTRFTILSVAYCLWQFWRGGLCTTCVHLRATFLDTRDRCMRKLPVVAAHTLHLVTLLMPINALVAPWQACSTRRALWLRQTPDIFCALQLGTTPAPTARCVRCQGTLVSGNGRRVSVWPLSGPNCREP